MHPFRYLMQTVLQRLIAYRLCLYVAHFEALHCILVPTDKYTQPKYHIRELMIVILTVSKGLETAVGG